MSTASEVSRGRRSDGNSNGVPDVQALYERHLALDSVLPPQSATARDAFEAVARAVRDYLAPTWLQTQERYRASNCKRVYYLSLEFLIGRTLANNVTNLRLEEYWGQLCKVCGIDPVAIVESEPDAGLGNGGLGRLAACFLDSMATLALPGMGYGLRYEYGIFKQRIINGWQSEAPDHWLGRPDPWEVCRPHEAVEVNLGCSFEIRQGALRPIMGRPSKLIGIPYDRPIVGYGGKTVNTLRLWAAGTPDYFDFAEFSGGDFVGALAEQIAAETLTRVLYPDDSTSQGKALRFVQQYFLVACSIADIVRRIRTSGGSLRDVDQKAAVQLNDTHPSLAVPELMRVLLDDEKLGWDQAWALTSRTLAYTNHTILPEALEKWPIGWFELLMPRHLEIVYEINKRFMDEVGTRFPGDDARLQRMSLIEESPHRQVRMAHMAIVGCHSTNGVARIHTDLLKRNVFPDFADLFSDRFNNKTNGVTQRRFLLLSNPALARLITESIGDGWITDLSKVAKLEQFIDDKRFGAAFRRAKLEARKRFTGWLKQRCGIEVDPDTLFDSHIKRIHEYKRQLLNALHIVMLYNRLRRDPKGEAVRRTFIFAGKAAPAYTFAKLVIKLINRLSEVIARDRAVSNRLQVVFVPDYCVSAAEYLIPASDISEQISTAGYEASGTSNMKFMMNGALTVGTRDGATIEMAEAAGEQNMFLFGLTAEQVAESRPWYGPRWHYDHEPETREAIDFIASREFAGDDAGTFGPIVNMLLNSDHYMHLADLQSYATAQERVNELYSDEVAWTRMAIRNVAASARFSSDRTIEEYARDVWQVKPCRGD